MSTDIENNDWRKNRSSINQHNNIITGIFLLLLGTGILIRKMHVGVPDWVFSWEMLMLVFGLYIGIRHQFRGPFWLILILIGGISLQDNISPYMNLKQYTWPAILIIMGLYFILRPKTAMRRRYRNDYQYREREVTNYKSSDTSLEDRLDVTTILGNVKKVVVSKNFRGGDIVSFLGGSDINLSQADIQGRVRLEATNIMAGTKLIVPPTWDVQSELVAIFGGVEDKRDMRSVNIDPDKVLVLEGTCIFGGIEIKSY